MHYLNDFPAPTLCIESTHSTNSYLSELCANQPITEMSTVVANYQTAGRGQRGNTWESSPNCNLLFSFVLYPSFLLPRQQFRISQVVALSIKEVLSRYTDHIRIKWPNDIYWKDKKIGGILIENDLAGHSISRSIAGIGLNINQKEFTSDAPNPISLYQIVGTESDRFEVLRQILVQTIHNYRLLQTGHSAMIANSYMEALFRKSGFYLYRDAEGVFRGEIVDIADDGKLTLKDKQGKERSYYFKEVEALI